MIARVKDEFDRGVSRIKWFAEVFSERVRIELAIFKLLLTADKKRRRWSELALKVGERMYELRGQAGTSPQSDKDIREALKEMELIDTELAELKGKASSLEKPEL